MFEKHFTVYLMTNRPRGLLYVGVTSDLRACVLDHRAATSDGPSSKWRYRRLVWFETFPDAESAGEFEEHLKHWQREWKVALVEKSNPDWRDLGPDIGAGEAAD